MLLIAMAGEPAEANMTVNRATMMLTHVHPRLLFRGPAFDARRALRAVVAMLRQAMCGIGGHDYYVRSTADRMFLRCLVCGRETNGWRIEINTNQGSGITRRSSMT